MRAESNIKPKKFEIENVKDGRCDIVLYDNIQEVMDQDIKKYTFDIYRLEICYDEKNKIDSEYGRYLEVAKNKEKEQMAKEIREKRNKLLEETDKEMCIDRLNIQFPKDLSMSNLITGLKQFFEGLSTISNGEMAQYRRKLRDITKQPDFPYNVIFPEKPHIK